MPAAAPLVPPKASEHSLGPFRTCQWIEADHKPWRFCEAPTVKGSAWCAGHYKRVYPPRSRAYQEEVR